MRFKFIIEITQTGFSAYEECEPIFTTGRTMLETQQHALEAVNLFLEERNKTVNSDKLDFEIDFQQFFDFYKVINAKHLASRIGMNESLLSQYVNGIKKPSRKQVERIIDGLHEIGQELMEISLI